MLSGIPMLISKVQNQCYHRYRMFFFQLAAVRCTLIAKYPERHFRFNGGLVLQSADGKLYFPVLPVFYNITFLLMQCSRGVASVLGMYSSGFKVFRLYALLPFKHQYIDNISKYVVVVLEYLFCQVFFTHSLLHSPPYGSL